MAIEGLAVAKGTVMVCRGGDCRRGPGYKKLCEALDTNGAVVQAVGCLGICSGPAVAITIGDRIEFIEKVRGALRDDIVAVTIGDQAPSRRLRKRMLRRSDRTKATKKLTKRLKQSA